MINDILFTGGMVADKNGVCCAGIAVRDGKITGVSDNPALLGAARKTVDARGMLIMPGMIDTHTHIRGGGFSYREDFYTGTRAAASGGVTTVLEMPGGSAPVSEPAAFEARLAEMRQHCAVDFGMYAGAGFDNLSDVPALAQLGAIGFKTFLNQPLKGREHEFRGLCAPDADSLTRVMETVRETGLTLTVHCEDYGIIQVRSAAERSRSAGQSDLAAYMRSRPPAAEIAAVKIALACAEKTGCPLNVAHVSTAEAARMISAAKRRGMDVCAESTMHYLFYSAEEMAAYGSAAKMKPPFREAGEVLALKELLSSGEIDYLGSDHAPFTAAEKQSPALWDAPDGLAGIELMFLLLLEAVSRGEVTVARAAEVSSFGAAQRFGLKHKGMLQPGYDADLVMIRRNLPGYSVRRSTLLTKAQHSGVIYENTVLHNRIERVYQGGVPVMNGGAVNTHPGAGRFQTGEGEAQKC
ncbi:MAG: dihydroorotase family protein [Oscillospiraceae bacterium]